PAGGERAAHGRPGIQGRTVEEIRKLADYYASVNQVPSGLVKAVIETESNYNPRAVSPKGAKGLMQLMPSVIKDFGVSDPFDPNENISAGTGLLKDLLAEYGGDYASALAAYNAGRRAVSESGGMPGFSETREYVKKVIDSYLKNSE
ncbi:MAG: lytic transglycosylase domain-containing protein, partial [Spirochaetes bacterium]|nr:lytic transglycosylase domain-containing protein [Spirochaetota bacterium]